MNIKFKWYRLFISEFVLLSVKICIFKIQNTAVDIKTVKKVIYNTKNMFSLYYRLNLNLVTDCFSHFVIDF